MAKKVADDSDTITNYLKNIRDIAFVAAVFLYFAGWIYSYNYFKELGLPQKAADLELYSLLIYSSNVFIYLINYCKIYLVLLVGVIVLLLFWKRANIIAAKLIPLIVVALFPLLFYIAQTAAKNDVKATFLNQPKYLKNITFLFKEAKAGIANEKFSTQDSILKAERDKIFIRDANERFKLLVANKEEYCVLLTDTSVTESNYNSYVPVIYIIKKESVEFVRISK
jgi:hypothetical protein